MDLSKEFFINIRGVVVFIGITILFTSGVQAQTRHVEEGDRVKISAPWVYPGDLKGSILSISSTQYTIAFKDTTLMVPFYEIETMAVSTGLRRNAGKGAIIGAAAGGLTGGLMFALLNKPCDEDTDWCLIEMSDGEAFGYGVLLGAISGGAKGAIIGYFIKTEKWEKVPIRVSMGFSPSSYPSVSVRFPIGR